MTERKLTRPCVDKLTPYTPGKPIEEVQREFGLTDIVKLASNENPLGPSPKAVEAICRAASEVWLYPDNDCYHLRRALSEKLGFPGEQILLGHGSDGLIHNIGLAFIRPGEEVLMSTAPFSQWDFTAKLMDGLPVYVPMKDFRYDTEAMAARVSAKTKLVFIGNPHNPTGAMVTKAELETLLAALTDSTILVMDEAYYDYVDDPQYPDSLALVKQGRPVIVLRTFSKSYGLAGLRMGYGVTTPVLADAMGRVREPFDVNSMAQAAAVASLQDPAQVERTKALSQESKQLMYEAFKQLGLAYTESYTNFVWVDVGRDCREVFLELLKRGVIVRTGDIFGAPTHLRVSTGTVEQTQRFAAALEEVLGGSAG
jgi:histidinol-phosphate aminotransferase